MSLNTYELTSICKNADTRFSNNLYSQVGIRQLFYANRLHSEAITVTHKGDTDLDDSDFDKDEDDSTEAYESKLSKMLNSFERMKEKLNSKLNNAIKKFLEKESFRIFKEKMTNIIVEENT
uniref:Uncharacterized protein n=1 Tax=Lactuca sativa TaxID=4236 RepID=A0A9R1UL90_LACSA|nr:hypothetical protein LSAT_V11C800448660 [Lactuca sativa]